MSFKRLTIAAAVATALALLAVPSKAQQNYGQQRMRESQLTVKEAAERRASWMDKAIDLDPKTYKKVVNWYKKEVKYQRQVMEERFAAMGEFQGMGQGERGHEGGMRPEGGQNDGFRGHRPEGEHNGEFHGQRPEGGRNGEFRGQRPGGFRGGMMQMTEEDKAFYKKQDQKLRKILTTEQYELWKAKNSRGFRRHR